LDVYGALHCGKIYTVFLQMPGKGWALQYCRTPRPDGKTAGPTRSAVVHLEEGTLPPDAEARFDFQRQRLPAEKLHKLIVLRGTIREDGKVDNLQVYHGLLPEMDEAARRAFAQWKFKPAMHAGKAVAVEILIGIPSDPPTWRPPI
jgi:hypothetical protein